MGKLVRRLCSGNTDEAANLDQILREGDPLPIVAVAVGTMPYGNTHAGIVYRESDDSDRLHLAHLAWHIDLRDEILEGLTHCGEWEADIICISPIIDEIDAINVAIYCRGIIRSNPDLPYGLSYNEDGYFEIIEGNAEFMIPEERRWLNCSTFVLTVFKSAGVSLVRAGEWPERPEEDSEWQEKLTMWLRKAASPEHVARVRQDIGKARIRPEETIGSCLESELPAGFRRCERNGKALIERMRSAIPHPQSSGRGD